MVLSLIFRKGFAILDNLEVLYSLMADERDVELRSFPSVEAGYVYACRQCVEQWLRRGYNQQIPLPRLDDLIQAGGVYRNPLVANWVCPIYQSCELDGEPLRYFSIVAPFVCAYVDSLDNLFRIIFQYKLQYIHVQEFKNPMDAKAFTICNYQMTHMSFGAYLTGVIHLPGDLRLNEVFYEERTRLMPQFTKLIGAIE